MKNIIQGNVSDLLTCFFSECENRFHFLERDHSYRRLSGLLEYKRGHKIIKPYHGQGVAGVFWAVVRYEKDDHALEVSFGDKNFAIEGFLYRGRIDRLAFSDLLYASPEEAALVTAKNWVVEKSQMAQITDNMAGTIQKNIQLFFETDEKIFTKALTLRNARIEYALRAQFERDMLELARLAAKAFLDKDYKRVVELLQPLKKCLAPAELKKLNLARKKLLQDQE